MADSTEALKAKLMTKTAPDEEVMAVNPKDLLGSGCTLLNIAATGKARGAYAKGTMIWFVGDSTSGKTWFSLTAFAEACANPVFENYRLIYDDAERGAMMDIERYFGRKVLERMEPPGRYKDGTPRNSEFIEDFYFNVTAALDEAEKSGGKPFIYVLDSMDAVSSKSEEKKFREMMEVYEDSDGDDDVEDDEENETEKVGKKAAPKGDYGDGKAKVNSRNLRRVVNRLRLSGSILIIVSQTRENIGPNAMFNPKTYAGGKALKFYSHLMMWTSVVQTLKKTALGKERQIGVQCRIKIEKSRFTGRARTVDVPIFHSYGFDDIGSCVDYLCEEKRWSKKGNKIEATDLDFEGTREALIKHIEENGREKELRLAVAETWDAIEEACAVRRKPRYE